MTPEEYKEIQKANRILTEKGTGKCWHEFVYSHVHWKPICKKCGIAEFDYSQIREESRKNEMPDFTHWQHFGELLTVAGENEIDVVLEVDRNGIKLDVGDLMHTRCPEVAKIPLIIALEVARLLDEEETPCNQKAN